MKNRLMIVLGLCLFCATLRAEKVNELAGRCLGGEKVRLQQNQGGTVKELATVTADSSGHFYFEYPCPDIRIFSLVTVNSGKNLLLVALPGEKTFVDLTGNKPVWKGDGMERFESIQHYQEEKQRWNKEYPSLLTDIAHYRQNVERQYRASEQYLKQADLSEEVKGILRADALAGYYGDLLKLPFLYQLITGVRGELPEDFYSFLPDIDLSSPHLRQLGNGCSFLQDYFIALESEGYLKSEKDDYLLKRAELIQDPRLRENYLLYVIGEVELYGFNQYLGPQLEQMRSWMVTPEGRSQLEELSRKYQESIPYHIRLTAGQPAFDFAGIDSQGHKHRLSDYKGKVVVVDVWNTGCKPCIAEIPYLKKLEQKFKGKDVIFISYSLDTKEEVWKKFLEKHEMEGNQWVNTEAFKSDFVRDYMINFIPRFLVFSKAGTIVEAYAPRPSNPRLAQLIEEELIR